MTESKSVIISVVMLIAFELAWYTGSGPLVAGGGAIALSILIRCWIGHRAARSGGEFKLG